MNIDLKKIDEQIIIDFLQEGTSNDYYEYYITAFKDYGYFQEIYYIYNNGNTQKEEISLVSINKKELFNFIRRRKINKIIGKDEQHITENTHF